MKEIVREPLVKSTTRQINQTAHGFSLLAPVYFNSTSWVLAYANNVSQSNVTGIVTRIIDANRFEITIDGYFKLTTTSGSLVANTVLYLTATGTAGTVPTTTGYIKKTLIIGESSSSGFVCIGEGELIGQLNVDTITENTLNSGVTIENVTMIDGMKCRKVTATHAFAVGNWIYRKSDGTYAKAKADLESTAEVMGIVVKINGTTDFWYVTEGYVTDLSGMTVGEVQWLSPTTAGAQTETKPTVVSQIEAPLGVALSATEMTVNIMRGLAVGGAYLYTSIGLNLASSTIVQNVSNFPDGTGGKIQGYIAVDVAGTHQGCGVEITFFKKSSTSYDISALFPANSIVPASGALAASVNETNGDISITLPTITGASAATITFAINGSPLGASLPLQIDSNLITWTEGREILGFGITPVGSVIATLPYLTGAYNCTATTAADTKGFVQCNGQTIVDATSVMNGTVIPNINNGVFLKGSTTSGTVGGSNSITLVANNIPQISTSYTPTGTNAASAISSGSAASDGTHVHDITTNPGTPVLFNAPASNAWYSVTMVANTVANLAYALQAASAGAHTHSVTGTANAQAFTGNAATITVGTGSPTSFDNQPSYITAKYIIRIK